jgi:tRNA (guanine-N7-)-methyltransferase
METATARRAVRSFVLREGRITPGQQRAIERLWPRFGVDWQPGEAPLDLHALFGNHRPVSLEIGFGNGETLLGLAQAAPEGNFLGVEVHRPGIGRLLRALEEREIPNVRVLRQDALELLRTGLAEATLAAVYLLFPDPWPKQRHHKRRLVTTELVGLLARVLQPDGLFHAASDWPDYADQMLAALGRAGPWFENLAGAGQFFPRPAWRPRTRFEQRGERLGQPARDLAFRRR